MLATVLDSRQRGLKPSTHLSAPGPENAAGVERLSVSPSEWLIGTAGLCWRTDSHARETFGRHRCADGARLQSRAAIIREGRTSVNGLGTSGGAAKDSLGGAPIGFRPVQRHSIHLDVRHGRGRSAGAAI